MSVKIRIVKISFSEIFLFYYTTMKYHTDILIEMIRKISVRYLTSFLQKRSLHTQHTLTHTLANQHAAAMHVCAHKQHVNKHDFCPFSVDSTHLNAQKFIKISQIIAKKVGCRIINKI